jgi:hypothetical protein
MDESYQLKPIAWRYLNTVVDLREVAAINGSTQYGANNVNITLKCGTKMVVAVHNNNEAASVVKSAVDAFEEYLGSLRTFGRL